MKGIILAGGAGSRLYPLTKVLSKPLLPIYDKPMVYYPLSILMKAGIREILIITTPEDSPRFKGVLGDGTQLGLEITWGVQYEHRGIADAFLIGESFIGKEPVALILGDNFFHGEPLFNQLPEMTTLVEGCKLFGIPVENPRAYGVLCFEHNQVVGIEEKPENPKSNYAVPGLYFYDHTVVEKAKQVTPNQKGELDITEVNKMYLKENALEAVLLNEEMVWLDTGTHKDLLKATNFVANKEIEGIFVGGIEVIAYENGWISKTTFQELAQELSQTEYGSYLKEYISGK